MFQTTQKKDTVLLKVITDEGEAAGLEVMDQAVLVRTAQRESRALIRSLGREMAKREGQARLDTFGMQQGMRVGQEVLVSAAEAMAKANDCGRLAAQRHPEVSVEILEMTKEVIDLFCQMPRVATVGYTSRHYNIFPNKNRNTRRDC